MGTTRRVSQASDDAWVLPRDCYHETAARRRATRALVFVSTAGAVGVLVLAGAHIRSELRQRRRREASVRKAYADFESMLHRDVQRALEGANQLKDDFLATVSHELRTPLNAIVGWSHVLTLPGVPESDRIRAVDAIQRNAREQTRLIEELLDVSSMIRGRLGITVSSVDLREVAEQAPETMAPTAHARDVRLTLDLADTPLVIAGDHDRLRQVVWNLLSNAVKFSAQGGEVRIRADRMGSRCRLRVDDGGEGIEPAFLPHVFEPFRQGPSMAMRSGLGLGLAIVRRLVELHGGTILAESNGRGKGASFTIAFPLWRNDAY